MEPFEDPQHPLNDPMYRGLLVFSAISDGTQS